MPQLPRFEWEREGPKDALSVCLFFAQVKQGPETWLPDLGDSVFCSPSMDRGKLKRRASAQKNE